MKVARHAGSWVRVIAVLLLLQGCVKNYELDAVQQIGRPTPARGDHPRVSLDPAALSVKSSFLLLLNQQCSAAALSKALAKRGAVLNLQTAPTATPVAKVVSHPAGTTTTPSPPANATAPATTDKPKWDVLNPGSNICQQRITAYAIDQCKFIVQHQNQASVTTGLITSLFSAGSALAVDVAYLTHPQAAKDSSTALIASSVLANSDKIKVLNTTTVSIKDMVPIGAQYAELIGLNDSDDVQAAYVAKDDAALKFARTHDAIMSTCTGVAVGL